MKFKAMIFDLDGTLLNSLEDLADATTSNQTTTKSLRHRSPPLNHELLGFIVS